MSCRLPSRNINLEELSHDLNNRLVSMFKKDNDGNRPVHALHKEWYRDEHFKDLISVL